MIMLASIKIMMFLFVVTGTPAVASQPDGNGPDAEETIRTLTQAIIDIAVTKTFSWVRYWAGFSDADWARHCAGRLGYTEEQWLEYFSQYSMADWAAWQFSYILSKARKAGARYITNLRIRACM